MCKFLKRVFFRPTFKEVFNKTICLCYNKYLEESCYNFEKDKIEKLFQQNDINLNLTLEPFNDSNTNYTELNYSNIFDIFFNLYYFNDYANSIVSYLYDEEKVLKKIEVFEFHLSSLIVSLSSIELALSKNNQLTTKYYRFDYQSTLLQLKTFITEYERDSNDIKTQMFLKDFIKYEINDLKERINIYKFVFPLQVILISPFFKKQTKFFAKTLYNVFRILFENSYIKQLVIQTRNLAIRKRVNKRRNTDGTSRILGLFAKKNDDLFLFRLDFPHRGETKIHINIEETEHSKLEYSGFPLTLSEINSLGLTNKQIESIFFQLDDLFWFRCEKNKKINQLEKTTSEQKRMLTQLWKKQSHYKIISKRYEKQFAKFVNYYTYFLEYMNFENLIYEDFQMDKDKSVQLIEKFRDKIQNYYIQQIWFLLLKGQSITDLKANTNFDPALIDTVFEVLKKNKII